jgi:hypothetical protein
MGEAWSPVPRWIPLRLRFDLGGLVAGAIGGDHFDGHRLALRHLTVVV